MITKETCEKIWNCYRDIDAGKKLITDLVELKEKEPYDKFAQNLRDAFGRRRQLQLGVPSGENAHRIFDLAPELAESILVSHIAKKEAELVTLNERAKIEANGSAVSAAPGD